MLKVRLQRVGRKNDPSFRLVVIESTKGPKSADHIEILGSHNPRQKATDIKADRVKYWISKGAQTSDTVHNLLISQKIIEGKKVNPLGKKTPIIDEEAIKKAEEEKAAAEEAAKAEAEAPAESEAPAADESTEAEATEEAPAEETKEEETPAEEAKAESEAPAAEDSPAEEKKETE